MFLGVNGRTQNRIDLQNLECYALKTSKNYLALLTTPTTSSMLHFLVDLQSKAPQHSQVNKYVQEKSLVKRIFPKIERQPYDEGQKPRHDVIGRKLFNM